MAFGYRRLKVTARLPLLMERSSLLCPETSLGYCFRYPSGTLCFQFGVSLLKLNSRKRGILTMKRLLGKLVLTPEVSVVGLWAWIGTLGAD